MQSLDKKSKEFLSRNLPFQSVLNNERITDESIVDLVSMKICCDVTGDAMKTIAGIKKQIQKKSPQN